MADNELWFGTLYDTKVPGTSTNTKLAQMQWVPCPDTGMGAGAEGYSELLAFENGGADVVASAATHRVYDMNWGTRVGAGPGGLDTVRSYQQGLFGPGLIYFCDPMAGNLFPPNWATPHIISQGWENISRGPLIGLNPNTGFPSQPRSVAVFNMADTGTGAPTDPAHYAVIPIPPTHTLKMGFTGSVTGLGAIRVRPILANGAYATAVIATLLSANSGQITNLSYSGATYSAVEVWLQTTGTGAAGVILYSSHAQLVPNSNPGPTNITGNYVPGAGHTGCKFTSSAIVEQYVMADRTLKGMSTQLTEVGAWQRPGT